MSEYERELTPKQVSRINRLIRKECYNYIDGECIALDGGCTCPQTISVHLFCKWFKTALLPMDRELYAELCAPELQKTCVMCGGLFASLSNNVKYYPACRKRVRRTQAAERKRRQREQQRDVTQ